MSNDVSSKVYLFLAKQGDWVTAADKNGDGTVIKSEFRQYMEDNYNWNGEDASAKSDLINQFWKEIDTKQSGKLNKKLNNKGALDKNEINAMDNKIKMYETLNNFTGTIEVPSVVQDRTNWKKSVSESLANKVEAYIKSNKNADNLEAYLQEISPEIERKATADYCANQYLNTEMKDIVKQYGYSYADDSTLQGMIDTYIGQLSATSGEVPSDEDINETVINIINEYLSTAELKDSDGFDLSQFGYTANNNSQLNDLQKSIIKSKMQTNLQNISNESDYNTYKSLYDEAVNNFIDGVLTDGKFSDFAKLQDYGINEFKNSDSYKSVKKAISVKSYINSADFKSAISSAVSSSFAERISNVMDEVPAYNTLISDIMTKAQNGEFDNSDGSLDTDKMQKYIIEQIKSNIADFYKKGLDSMPLDDLGTMYDTLVETARENNDSSKVKEAAISYCQAVSKKSTTLAQAVKDVFGSGYAATINDMYAYDIDSKMTTLKAKVAEIGDVSTMSDYEKNSILSGIKSNYEVSISEAQTFQLPTSATNNGKTVTTDRITYTASGCLSVDTSGKVTIDSSKAGTYTGTVTIYIDGEMISSKTVTVNVKNSYSADALVKNVTDWASAPKGISVMREANKNNVGDAISSSDFADIYNNDNIIVLSWHKDDDNYNWNKNGASEVKSKLTSLSTSIVDTLSSSNKGLDKTLLQKAANTVVNRYAVNPQGVYYQKKRSGDTPANCFNYMTQNKYKVKNGLVQTKDPDGSDSNIYAIYFKEFVDAIIAEYNKLVA